MNASLVLTVIGPDKPGLVNLLSQTAVAFGANWLESRMANLVGQFAGIVHLDVPEANADPLIAALGELESLGLRVLVTKSAGTSTDPATHLLHLELVGQDHPGIVRDISRVFALHGASIEDLSTDCVSGSFSGENLFRAKAQLRLPPGSATVELRHALEALANELMVDVTLDEGAGKS
jgi:glycine cleavage system regulatory protein